MSEPADRPFLWTKTSTILRSRTALPELPHHTRKSTAEGGCGVIGIACSEPIAGRHLLRALIQMRNRGNGKGGGVAIAGLKSEGLGVSQDTLNDCYLLTLAFLDPTSRGEVERSHIKPYFEIQDLVEFNPLPLEGLEQPAPPVVGYFVRAKTGVLDNFRDIHNLAEIPMGELEDEFVYQNSFRLNSSYYASLGEKRAFVLSHGKDMLVFKLVSFGEQVIQAYQLEELHAHVWIGHHRYPTKGRVWHPGGAHPFVGMHEALVHNGDFANYAAVSEYLRQHNIQPLFLTDTEVSVLMFDLLHRTFKYPLEYVIETLAPTTERDFTLLPNEKREIYQQLQATHIHGSPDGPWFFLIAQSKRGDNGRQEPSLIGITDTSMLRPQVFALQDHGAGAPAIGLAASEKQAIDATLQSLAAEDNRFWPRADRYWNARGGSHTDGGAFIFRVTWGTSQSPRLVCADKFGRQIQVREEAEPFQINKAHFDDLTRSTHSSTEDAEAAFKGIITRMKDASYEEIVASLQGLLNNLEGDDQREHALTCLSLLIDRNYPTGSLRVSSLLSIYDRALERWARAIEETPSDGFQHHAHGQPHPHPKHRGQKIVIDARNFPAEGPGSLALELVRLVEMGFRHLVVLSVRGQRFIANGLGSNTGGVTMEVFGSPGDYLGSGIDGLELIVHSSAQDQVAQIMKSGTLVIYGDVGQVFMYGAKGGKAFVRGSAAGRPLINAVGKPHVVINGTCLDYLAESFMAGDPLHGGGFVILNGMHANQMGEWEPLETPFPGGNLFSLASGGAIFLRDPHHLVGDDQLNGGVFTTLNLPYWELIRPLLEENEKRIGLSLERLLQVDGDRARPEEVYRLILPSRVKALQPEEHWVHSNTDS